MIFQLQKHTWFPKIIEKNSSNNESHEDVPYNAESLFMGIPVQEKTDYILQRIYINEEIKPFCKK